MLNVLYKENKEQYLSNCLMKHKNFCLTDNEKAFIKQLLLLIDYYMEFVLSDYDCKTMAHILTLLKIDIHGNSMFLYLIEDAIRNEDNSLSTFQVAVLNNYYKKVVVDYKQEKVLLALQVINADYMLNPESNVMVANLIQLALLKFNMPNNKINDELFGSLIENVLNGKNNKLFIEFSPHYENLLKNTDVRFKEESLNVIKKYYSKIPEHIRKKLLNKDLSIMVYHGRLNRDGSLSLGSTHLCNNKMRIWFEDDKKAIELSFYHEFGHCVDAYAEELFSRTCGEWEEAYNREKQLFFSYLEAKNKKLEAIWQNAISDKTEYFAEVFSEYIKDKNSLKKYCPETYKLMDEYLKK